LRAESNFFGARDGRATRTCTVATPLAARIVFGTKLTQVVKKTGNLGIIVSEARSHNHRCRGNPS